MIGRAIGLAGAALIVASIQAVFDPSHAASAGGDGDPPRRLADTGLYAPGNPGIVDARNRAFSPQYPLWSDGAAKTRWVYLPDGETIDAVDVHEWDFPVGTRFWKEFSFAGRKVETRFLWKASRDRWVAASYMWNVEGTDAVLAPEDGAAVVEIAPGRWHRIPSRADCAACHGTDPTAPLGFNALQLSPDRDPNAIHGEPLAPGSVTLHTLVQERRLSPAHAGLAAAPPRIATANPQTRAVLGYLFANCASCHNGKGEISAGAPVLTARDLLQNADAVAAGLVRHPTRWQVPGTAEGHSVLIDPASPDSSALLARMRSRSPSSQMPPLGTVLRDQAAVDAVSEWIAHGLARASAAVLPQRDVEQAAIPGAIGSGHGAAFESDGK